MWENYLIGPSKARMPWHGEFWYTDGYKKENLAEVWVYRWGEVKKWVTPYVAATEMQVEMFDKAAAA